MAFKFRLEKVLTLRRDAVDEAQRAVIQAELALKRAEERVVQLSTELRERNEDLIRNNYELAQEHLRAIKFLTEKLDEARKDVLTKKQELIDAKNALLEAQKKLEALEKLKEKQAEEFYLEQNRLEQKQSDEKATLKFTTDMRQRELENVEEDERNDADGTFRTGS